jgi:hypothetical protein
MPPATLNLCLKLLSALADGLMLVFEHPAMLTEFYPVMPEDAPFKQQDGALLAFAREHMACEPQQVVVVVEYYETICS